MRYLPLFNADRMILLLH